MEYKRERSVQFMNDTEQIKHLLRAIMIGSLTLSIGTSLNDFRSSIILKYVPDNNAQKRMLFHLIFAIGCLFISIALIKACP